MWFVGLAVFLLSVGCARAAYDDVVLTRVAGGLSGPTAIVAPDDGSGRLFVVENLRGEGRIRVLDAAGGLLPAPYWSQRITGGPGSEQGMLGLAFDPEFARNGVLYVTYTAPADEPRLGVQPDQVLARLRASRPADSVFDGSVESVLRVPDIYSNHNGGNIAFGPDGYLYWGMGDGGSGGDPNGFAQDLWKKTVAGKTYYLLGKMLRLDVRHPAARAAANQCGATPGQPAPYAIPADNPHAGASERCGEIWLHGLRNPWRWSFDRQTGNLVIGDVGQNKWEEIDFRARGDSGVRNYGWNLCEGNHGYRSSAGDDCPARTDSVAPVLDYSHAQGCSVTGGYVYRGPVTALRGRYLFSDYCSGRIWVATMQGNEPWRHEALENTPSMNVSSFGEDSAGNVYVVDGGGTVYRIDSSRTTR